MSPKISFEDALVPFLPHNANESMKTKIHNFLTVLHRENDFHEEIRVNTLPGGI